MPFLDRGVMVLFSRLRPVCRNDLLHVLRSEYTALHAPSCHLQTRVAYSTPSQPFSDKEEFMEPLEKVKFQVKELTKEIAELETNLNRGSSERVRLCDVVKRQECVLREVRELKRDLSFLSAIENVLLRKLVERGRNKCMEVISFYYENTSFADWNEVLEDLNIIYLLGLHGLKCGWKATRYGPNSPRSRGDSATHVIMEDRALYAAVVCSKEGEEREELIDLYKFVFERSDPERDRFS